MSVATFNSICKPVHAGVSTPHNNVNMPEPSDIQSGEPLNTNTTNLHIHPY